MTQQNHDEFYNLVGYHYERFDAAGYTNLSLKAEDLCNSRKFYWQTLLADSIDCYAATSRSLKMPLITTECWGIATSPGTNNSPPPSNPPKSPHPSAKAASTPACGCQVQGRSCRCTIHVAAISRWFFARAQLTLRQPPFTIPARWRLRTN